MAGKGNRMTGVCKTYYATQTHIGMHMQNALHTSTYIMSTCMHTHKDVQSYTHIHKRNKYKQTSKNTCMLLNNTMHMCLHTQKGKPMYI